MVPALNYSRGVCTVSKVTLLGALTATFRTPAAPTNTSTEVARGKPVTAVPRYMTFVKEFAVDGRNDTKYHSDATGAYKTPWLLVNLQGAMLVHKVRLLPNVGVMPKRINNYQILLGNDEPPTAMDFSQYDVVGAIPGPVPLGEKWYEFDVSPPRCSRYVAVYKNVATPDYIMEISEMEVFVLN
ncbi:uncharacterized protein LOC125178009 [Hyalella azteca]|uniref:Uncharacterized protein LOC125178009 n=1 Tax=Hyalella azteca TaxID=294128 RepID=A0A979FJR8_HYAAZ|nr:uncharacterized protein LOC125178009 [Hyalella azteca]